MAKKKCFEKSNEITAIPELLDLLEIKGIENSLHWILDMSFNDGLSRIRRGNAPENMAAIKHFALNMPRQVQTKRQSIKGLRKSAGWDNELLARIVQQKNL